MQQSSRKTQSCQYLISGSNTNASNSYSNPYDAYIFDTVIRQKFFQVMLNDGEHYAIKSRNKGNDQDQITNGGEISFYN